MRSFATIFVLASAGLAVYWFMVRPVLAQWAAFKPLYDKLNEVEATFGFKLSMWFKGLKGMLWSMLLIIAPLVLAALQYLQQVDLTVVLPDQYDWLAPFITPLIISAIGYITLAINKRTDTPSGSPVPAEEAVVEVPTVAGKPDVALVVAGSEVVAEARTVKTPDAEAATATEPVKVAEVMQAVADGAAVVVKAKEAA